MAADTVERALRVLAHLQARPGWTAHELARDLGVTPRTVRRDIARLRDLGYAVEADRGAAGGYWLARGRAVPPLLFTEDEAIAVGVGLHRSAALAAGPYAEAALGALAKLDAALPAAVRANLSGLLDAVRHLGQAEAEADPAALALIAGAIRRHLRLRFSYPATPGRSAQGDRSRSVEPHRLVAADRRWYLSAYDLDRNDWRLFRLDRIRSLRASTLSFRPRDDEPDPVARLRAGGFGPAGHQVIVRIDAPLARLQPWFGDYGSRLRAVDEVTTELRTVTHRPAEVPGWLADLPAPFRVVGDDAVRAAFEAAAQRLTQALA